MKTMHTDYQKIALQGINGLTYVSPQEVIYAKGDGSYTHIELTNRRQVKVLKALNEMEQSLPSEKFSQIHRSYLVNVEHVIGLEAGDKVKMTNGESLVLAPHRKGEFIAKFTKA